MGYKVKKVLVWKGNIPDMQGPCPTGFHVPLDTEWQAVINGGVSLGAWTSSGDTNFSTMLKIPLAGSRNSSGNVNNQGTSGNYWTSYDNNNYPKELYVSQNSILLSDASPIGGYSIRPFKNKSVVPDSNRTTIYQGSGSAGIYYNSDLGLISISSDGSTWYTLADKNLGATTVYNYGDTLSQSNCGYYYQRGNNYGFAWTGSVTTSSTKVDASSYGPGNYYESSTFITASSFPYNWDSSNNANLRGGETGPLKEYQVYPAVQFATQ